MKTQLRLLVAAVAASLVMFACDGGSGGATGGGSGGGTGGGTGGGVGGGTGGDSGMPDGESTAVPVNGACEATWQCADGAECIVGRCLAACELASPPVACNCVDFDSIDDGIGGSGRCYEPCDLLGQDCPDAADACTFSLAFEVSQCFPAAASGGAQGDPCEPETFRCAEGHQCFEFDLANPGASRGCAEFCELTAMDPCGLGSGLTCVPMVGVYAFDLPERLDGVGVCVDCSAHPTFPGCTS